MRHSRAPGVMLVLSGYPALAETLSAIGLQSDTIPVKPIEIVSLREPFLQKLTYSAPSRSLPPNGVAPILEHDLDATIQYWIEVVELDEELTYIRLSFEERSSHIPISSLPR